MKRRRFKDGLTLITPRLYGFLVSATEQARGLSR
jgi:hypothetical protein